MVASNMRTVLVTGGFGFVGSHVVERLIADGARVVVVDDGSTSPVDADAFVRRVRDSMGTYERLLWSHEKLASYTPVAIRRSDIKFDEVYHLASVVGPVGVLVHAGEITRAVVGGTYNALDIAMAHRARLCVVSTSEVYGDMSVRDKHATAAREDDPKIIGTKPSARMEYAVAKLAGEVAVINAARATDDYAVIVRPFNVAGPRQSPNGGFVIPRFMRQALRGEPLTVYGDGTAVRAFTHVEDIADGILRAMLKGKSGEVYNLGNEANRTTIGDLAQRVWDHIRPTESPRIELVDPKTLHGPDFEEAPDKVPDSARARVMLDWTPKHDLDRVIRDAAAYLRAGRVD